MQIRSIVRFKWLPGASFSLLLFFPSIYIIILLLLLLYILFCCCVLLFVVVVWSRRTRRSKCVFACAYWKSQVSCSLCCTLEIFDPPGGNLLHDWTNFCGLQRLQCWPHFLTRAHPLTLYIAGGFVEVVFLST